MKTIRHTSTGRSAGLKQGGLAQSQRSYSLYDTCDKCPLRVYVELVCDDSLRALVIEGNPTDEALEEAKLGLITEFAELSGNSQSSASNNTLRTIYLLRSQVMILHILYRMALNGDDVLTELSELGIRGKMEGEENIKKLHRTIEAQVKLRNIKLAQEVKRYNAITVKGEGLKPTSAMFNEQLVVLSKHAGFRLNKEIMLAEYAAYLKDLKESVERKQAIDSRKRHV